MLVCTKLLYMKVSDYICKRVERLPKGYVFTYTEFVNESVQVEATIKALNRMVKSGKIAKLAKGKFYKPEDTAFGILMPEQKQIVKDLLENEGRITGYLTGYSIYNQLGLTTQLSNTIQIGSNQVRPDLQRDRYTISFIRQKNTITKVHIPLLQVLDALRYIKKIPDSTIQSSIGRFLVILKELSEHDMRSIVRLAMKYPPSTRALLGALFDQLQHEQYTGPLYNSLNPVTKYKLTGADKALTTITKWNII